MKLRKYTAALFISAALCASGCKDYLDTAPTTPTEQEILHTMGGIRAALTGTYSLMRNVPSWGVNLYSPPGILALSTTSGMDIMINNEQPGDYWNFYSFFTQRYEASQPVPTNLWAAMYAIIKNANIVIQNIDNIEGDATEKNNIKGQALAIRARCYFNLIRFYQHTYIIARNKPGVPVYLNTTTEPKERSTVEEVYKQILADLTTAETLLAEYSRGGSKEFYNDDVVHFLLANVYLTMNNWAKAQEYANKVRTAYPLMSMDEYKAGFSTTNAEWVLGYIQTSQDYWWYDSPACWWDFGQNDAPWQSELFLPVKHFVEVIMKDDPRNLTMPNPLYPGQYAATKFKELKKQPPYGDLFDMRAAEMYLVEAEAAARQGSTSTALQILNTLQNQRGAAVTSTTSQQQLIDAILLERRKEMWGEGLDYFDVARLQKPIVKRVADGHYQEVNLPANSNRLIMMIPMNEMINNPNMVQNPDPVQQPVFVP
ncbi:RagB/SusD family nutrient uptake outer membrane protein [Pararcticibacter amylolyticus]|uniref:RagB/SusD family nutrient uptake outer membrane protein n=1 Tax=Pararcticibacter amylolyticus TaxID=2173175 RepID=A0A2U2PK99_9SPHI|nr:RagB/SusD family nutrient uptake outer membrane protein [Pararcticibacter amylolyticus]PWG81836.1 hypothetical protein DDR33_05615 [Pararcticibacter amylolyticus]